MKIGTIIISNDNYYVSDNGKLPKRPSWDKKYITNLASNKVVLCSESTYKTIPPSIKKVAKKFTTNVNDSWEINFGIKTFNEEMDCFIIIKSSENLNSGKYFDKSRIKKYMKKTIDLPDFEMWIKN